RLFNRLMFIRFLEKKDWLRFDGDRNYLKAMREAARESHANFYDQHLYWAFFAGLGVGADNPSDRDLMLCRGEVPPLNGGLFEQEEDDQYGRAQIPNAAFDLILDELFARFNFTITESTPNDVEVAVDPEVLGKVFEELVTGRHETGSYYTPRPIVQFMCREALKGYLGLPEEGSDGTTEAIARLVDEHDAGGISVPQARAL